jgi:hypothetical protein
MLFCSERLGVGSIRCLPLENGEALMTYREKVDNWATVVMFALGYMMLSYVDTRIAIVVGGLHFIYTGWRT